MIDVTCEQPLTFPEASRLLPGNVHVSTIHRWRLRGVKGIRLETAVVGGRRYTSREALARFSAAVTAARDGVDSAAAATVRTPRQRQQAIDRADRELEKAGM